MDTQIYTQRVVNNTEVHDHVNDHLQWLNKIDPRSEFPKVRVWLTKSSDFISRGVPQFKTKILVSTPQKKFFVEAQNMRLAQSINGAARKLKHAVFTKRKGGHHG